MASTITATIAPSTMMIRGSSRLIAAVVKATLGLRPTVEAEQEGLDLSDHGEEGYIFEAKS